MRTWRAGRGERATAQGAWRRSRRGRRSALTVAAVAALALPGALPAGAAGWSVWRNRGAFPTVPAVVHAVSCPTTSLCVAAGVTYAGTGLILRSTDGGVHWSQMTVPLGTAELGDVSCGTATTCEATVLNNGFGGVEVIGSTDAGMTWHAQSLGIAADLADVETVRCFSATQCVLTGFGQGYEATVEMTTDGGATWSSISPFGNVDTFGVEGVDCTSATTCIITGWEGLQSTTVGVAARTTDGGITWTQLAVPADVQVVWEVACTSSTTCEAPAGTSGNSVVLGTTDSGATWTEQAIPSGASPLFISCPVASTCFASGYSHTVFNTSAGLLLTTTDGGTTWTPIALPGTSEDAQGISCPSATRCVLPGLSAHGFPQLYDVSSGTASLDPTLAYGVTGVFDVTCASLQRCVAAGDTSSPSLGSTGSILTSSTTGRTWTARTPDHTVAAYVSVSCPTPATCLSLGVASNDSTRVLERTTNAGATWSEVARGGWPVGTVTCHTTTSCLVYGGAILYTTPALHGHYAKGKLPKGVYAIFSASCVTATLCVGVGANQHQKPVAMRSTDAGRTWALVAVPTTRFQMDSLVCTSPRFCLAGGYATNNFSNQGAGTMERSTDGGLTWHLAKPPASTPGLTSVGCLSARDCVALGGADYATSLLVSTDGGVHWHYGHVAQGIEFEYSLRCSAAGCWTIGQKDDGTIELEVLR